MNVRTIRSIVRGNLLMIFLVALFAGGGGFYLLLENAALDQAEQEARLVLATAMSIRSYTTDRILPQLSRQHDGVFHEETVPFFATQTVFRGVSGQDSAYAYRESALDPTSPADRAAPFEVELIREFRDDAKLGEKRGVMDANGNRLFYLARPIRIEDRACLACHDTPARAPQALLTKYGSANGFGWKLGEVIGVQLVTVPVTKEFRSTLQLVAVLIGGLALIFAIAFFALNAAMDVAVVTPLGELAEAAEHASRAESAQPPLPQSGTREIRLLALSIQRLRESLAKALGELRARGGGDE